jgi:hypothetical protein
MSFASLNDDDGNEALAEINMIPLIDVMLVLLVIFIVTAPLLTHAVKVDLPKASSAPNLTKPDNVQLAIDGAGQVYWNGEVVAAPAWTRSCAPPPRSAAARAAPARRAHDTLREGRRGHVGRRARRADPHRLCHRTQGPLRRQDNPIQPASPSSDQPATRLPRGHTMNHKPFAMPLRPCCRRRRGRCPPWPRKPQRSYPPSASRPMPTSPTATAPRPRASARCCRTRTTSRRR